MGHILGVLWVFGSLDDWGLFCDPWESYQPGNRDDERAGAFWLKKTSRKKKQHEHQELNKSNEHRAVLTRP